MRLYLLLSLGFALVLVLVGFLTVRFNRPAVVEPVPHPTSTAEKLVGTWRCVKTELGDLPEAVYIVDFTRDGTRTVRRTVPNKPTKIWTDPYTVEGDTIRITTSGLAFPLSWRVLTIVLLTEDRLVVVPPPELGGGEQSEFERVWAR